MADMQNHPKETSVSISVCNERSRRIEDKLVDLKAALDRVDQRLEQIVDNHERRIRDAQSSIAKINQASTDNEKAQEKNQKRVMLWVAIVAVVVALFSNLDKIIAAVK
jgi:predicted  nucleic acid-binding Zn-ribbon protein